MELHKKLSDQSWNIVFVVGFTLLLGFALYQTWASSMLVMRGERATAVCIRVEHRSNHSRDNRSTSEVYHINFQTPDGKVHQAVIAPTLKSMRQGERVEVIYDPQKPSRVRLNDVINIWFAPVSLGIISLALILLFFRRQARIAAYPESPAS